MGNSLANVDHSTARRKRQRETAAAARLESALRKQAENVALEGQTGGTADGVAVQGQYAYIGVGQRLVIVDISDPAQPALAGQTDLLPGTVFDVVVAGDYTYLACFINGLRIIDVSDPEAPFEAGFCETGADAMDVALDGKLAYTSVVEVIDVSDPASPFQVGSYGVGYGAGMGVAVAGSRAYVAADGNGLMILRYVPPQQVYLPLVMRNC
jgi:hypothetical protein